MLNAMSLNHYFASLVFLVGFCLSGVCAVPMAVKNPPQVNLGAGTVLTVGVEYYASISANRTLTFTGTATEGAKIALTLDVTSASTLTIPTSYRMGHSGSTTSLTLSPLTHSLLWIRSNSKWILIDSAGPLNKLDATTAPTANDDSGDGYAVGSVWIDTTNDLVYQCVDATATAAVWKLLNSEAGFVGTYASPDTTGGAVTLTKAVTEVWTNTTTTYTLPAVASSAGKAVIFYVVGTNAITIDPNASEIIVRDGTAQTGGVTMTLTGAAGNYVCLICDGTRWVTLGYKGTLAAGS